MAKNTLKADQLYQPCKLTDAQIKNLKKFAPVIGQEKAFSALDFGLEILAPRYNMYCSGEKGLGRTTLTRQQVQKKASKEKTPSDFVYVYNFDQPRRPHYLELPAGEASKFAALMDRTIVLLYRFLQQPSQDENYRLALGILNDKIQKHQAQQFKKLQSSIKEKNVALVQTPQGHALFPALEPGNALTPDAFNALPISKRKPIMEQLERAQNRIAQLLEKTDFDTYRGEQTAYLQKTTVQNILNNVFADITQKYTALNVQRYIADVQKDILTGAPEFFNKDAEAFKKFARYQVNILTSHKPGTGAPVVHLALPSVQSLLGHIERSPYAGASDTDFMAITAGALHQANGGYLLIESSNMPADSAAWRILKQALYAMHITMDSDNDANGVFSQTALVPESIPLSVKVILIGRSFSAFKKDEDFNELFKIPVFFTDKIARTEKAEQHYAYILMDFIKNKNLKPLTPNAIRRLVEQAARVTSDQKSLTMYLSEVYDLMREANFLSSGKNIDVADLEKVQARREEHGNQPHLNILERIKRHDLTIDLSGYQANQVNGLSVMYTENISFVAPTRITCQIRAGKGIITDTENEVKLAGPSHIKSVMVLASYLAATYGNGEQLPIDATLTFEQSSTERDGDSASAASLLCLMSAVGNIPMDQGLAITGAVDQLGNLQPVGMVNEKIEGFFKTCSYIGLTGKQGVLIPTANAADLMLNKEVVDAVKRGKFRIFTADTIDDAMEIMAGKSIKTLNQQMRENLKRFVGVK